MKESDKKIPQAVGEWVILECKARKPGEEEKSALGIILEAKKEKNIGEVPLYGTVVSVGGECKDYIADLIGKDIALPNGRINNIPDPDVARKKIDQKDLSARIFVGVHQSAIQAIYTF